LLVDAQDELPSTDPPNSELEPNQKAGGSDLENAGLESE